MGQRKANQLKETEKHERSNDAHEIPQDIIFYNILVRIPPKALHDSFRYVCKSWDKLVSSSEFINKNATRQNPGILTQFAEIRGNNRTCRRSKTTLLEADESKLDMISLTNFTDRMGLVRSSCNGVILICEPQQRWTSVLCVKNMETGRGFTLPHCPSGCRHHLDACGTALGFNSATKQFKVVHVYADGYGFEIFTVGSDNSWRKIPGPFKESLERPFNTEEFRWSDPVCINGQILHWFVDSDKYVISMDIRDEQVRKTSLPSLGERIRSHNYDLIEMDGKLCFVYKASSCQIDVWVLEDFGKQIWVKKHSINAKFYSTIRDDENCAISENREEKKDKLPDFSKLAAVASLRNGEVMMFKHKKNTVHNDHLYLYDFKHEEMRKLKMKVREGQRFIAHRSSLWSVT